MKIETKCGQYRIETYTDGYPHWTKVYHEDGGKVLSVHHTEISDLEYLFSRQKEKLNDQVKESI